MVQKLGDPKIDRSKIHRSKIRRVQKSDGPKFWGSKTGRFGSKITGFPYDAVKKGSKTGRFGVKMDGLWGTQDRLLPDGETAERFAKHIMRSNAFCTNISDAAQQFQTPKNPVFGGPKSPQILGSKIWGRKIRGSKNWTIPNLGSQTGISRKPGFDAKNLPNGPKMGLFGGGTSKLKPCFWVF